MSVRVVKINIKDYRAFWGDQHNIALPNGENLLVYGENGSGKSSLFHGMYDFFKSSAEAVNLLKKANIFRGSGEQPSISLEFNDLNTQAYQTYFINEVQGLDFIEKANLRKAFFGYADIQSVHAVERQKTGHFHALMEILKDYEYRSKNIRLIDLWGEIKSVSQKRWSSVQEARMQEMLTTFDAAMTDLKSELTQKMQLILGYFDKSMQIEIDYKPATYDRFKKLLPPNFNVRVSYFNVALSDTYSEILNEARLSSLALSLYLSSLLTRPPHASDYKILFLDDALIGLDSGNRMPLLKVLHDLFEDYQIFITTYDRYWYEMAKDWFEKEALKQADTIPAKWLYYEMYSVLEPNKQYTFPVILPADSFLGKANRHMNNPVYPDYAAAANNFRKAAEEILLKWLPENELKDREGETPLIMLKGLLEICDSFLEKIEQPKTQITELSKYLKILLNPLSHYNPETPIHKGELQRIEPVLVALQSQLRKLREEHAYQVIGIPGDRNARFRFQAPSGDICFYVFELKDYWYKYATSDGRTNINDVKVSRVEILYGDKLSTSVENHNSLSEAYHSITSHLLSKGHIGPVAENATFTDVLEVCIDRDGSTWKSYQEIISTP